MSARNSHRTGKRARKQKRRRSFAQPPVFIVGAPRSGTSILTWCLGQHPNLLAVPESNWMAPFAVDLAVAYRRGSIRRDLAQLYSMGVKRERLMKDVGTSINEAIIAHRTAYLKHRKDNATLEELEDFAVFQIERSSSDPKRRWVNGTPEYSFGICGLLKLFPRARFVHLLRDCDRVAASMFHFDQVSGMKLVETETDGYRSWTRYVRAVMAAEEAYGPDIILRVKHSDLVAEPEVTFRQVLDFIGESFSEACLEPLAKKINSSQVTDEYATPTDITGHPAVQEARALWLQLTETPQPTSHPDAVDLIEEQFDKRVEYIFSLDIHSAALRDSYARLQAEFVERTDWALRLDRELRENGARIVDLQEQLVERTEWAENMLKEIAAKDARLAELQATSAERTQWALSLQSLLDEKAIVIRELQQTCEERTNWALSLQSELDQSAAVIRQLQQSCEERAN